MCYLIQFSEIKEKSLSELTEFLLFRKKSLDRMLIKDLVFYNEKEIFPGVGIYIFYNDKEKRFVYVGKCSHRTFSERIPSHFDLRSNGWFNSMLKRIIEKKTGMKISKIVDNNVDKLIIEQAKQCFENCSLSIISFDKTDKEENILKLENVLRTGLEPRPYNAANKRIVSEKKIIELMNSSINN